MTAVPSRWQPYPAYKPSGACLRRDASQRGRQVEWRGDMPEQWAVKRSEDVIGSIENDKDPPRLISLKEYLEKK